MDKWEEMELKANSNDLYEKAESAEFWYTQFSKLKLKTGGKVPAGFKDEFKIKAKIKKFSDIPIRKPQWLIEGHIPLGMLAIIGGDPGQGKSAVGLDIAARISNGLFIHSFFPIGKPEQNEQIEKGDVLITAGEDVPEFSIAPRLQAMGADTSRIFYLYGSENEDGKETTWNVRDTATVKDAIEQIEKNGGKLKLFIIDPLENFMSGDVDVYRNNEVRSNLRGIMDLAQEKNFTILAIQHLNKTTGSQSIYRFAGSIAFAAAARTVWIVTKDKDNPSSFLFANSKMNIAKKAPTYRYSIIDIDGIGIPCWEGIADVDAETALNGNSNSRDTPAQNEVLEVIRNRYPSAIKFSDIVSESGKSKGNVGNILKQLENAGKIKKVDYLSGHYILIEKTESIPEPVKTEPELIETTPEPVEELDIY